MQHQPLGTADGERRDHDHAAAGGHAAHDGRELGLLVDGDMRPIAVGGFADQHVAGGKRRGRVHQRLVLPSEVAAEVQAPAMHVQADMSSAQDVAGGVEAGADAGHHLDVLLVIVPLQLPQAQLGVTLGVKRERLLVLGITLARRVLRLFLQQVPTVREQQSAQGGTAFGAVNLTAESLLDQYRQIARMIEVRMGKHDRVDGGRLDRERRPVAFAQLLVALEQPAVDEHAVPAGFDQVTGAGHGAGGAEKLQGGWR